MPQQYRSVILSEEQAHEYYSLLMQSDPYPGDESSHEIAVTIANAIALQFGHESWIVHYHTLGNQGGKN